MSAPTGTTPVRSNCFDLLRIGAAAMVVVDHVAVTLGHRRPVLLSWGRESLEVGGAAVLVFFVVSGYLVTASWTGDPDLRRFLAKRALRIVPGLAFVVVLTTFVLGTLMTRLPLSAYLHESGTWTYLRTAVLAPVEQSLPGVFDRNPAAYVNGSLWTLPYEVVCYAIVSILGFTGLLRRRHTVGIVLVAMTALMVTLPATSALGIAATMFAGFAAGAALQVYGVALTRRRAAFAAAVLALSVPVGIFALAFPAFAFLVVFAGTRRARLATALSRYGDPSYGMYIYAYPIQQTIVALGVRTTVPALVAAVPLVALAGYASWYAVERPALRRGRRLLSARRTTEGSPTPDPAREASSTPSVALTPTAS